MLKRLLLFSLPFFFLRRRWLVTYCSFSTVVVDVGAPAATVDAIDISCKTA